MDDFFGQLSRFTRLNLVSELCARTTIARTHIIFDFVVLGSEVKAEVAAQHDIMCITFGSFWMPGNVYHTIIAGWVFQLSGEVTCKLCLSSIDVVEIGVDSIPKQNYVLCFAIIPKETESIKVYQITWDDLHAAAMLLSSYKH
jgi:hypothetical protein